VITKTPQQDTDRGGKRLLRSALEPFGWIVNDVQEDFGIDSNVQVFEGPTPTGAWFHVQLKSSTSPAYSADGSFISQELRVDHARHFALELHQPVFLIIADVTQNRLFWVCPQFDERLLSQLQTPSSLGDTITVRVSTENVISTIAAPALLTGLSRAYAVLTNRHVAETPTAAFLAALPLTGDRETIRAGYQDKSDTLKLERIGALYRDGDLAAARERGEALLRDPDANIETRFWASVQLGSLKFTEAATSGKPQEELGKVLLANAISLQELVRSASSPFKFYALVSRKAAELEILAHENFSLHMLQKAHLQRGGDPLVVIHAYVRRAVLGKRIGAKYNQCVRLARYAARSPEPWLAGRAFAGVVNSLASYAATLRAEGQTKLFESFSRSSLSVSKFAAWASKVTEDDTGLIMSLQSAVLIPHSEDSETYKWAMETAKAIADSNSRQNAIAGLQRAARRFRGEDIPGDYSGDTVWQALQNMATARGVDISDENSLLVQALRIAVKDDTPDRVMKECEHLVVSYGAVGPMALRVSKLFNMKTACSKVVHCMLHDFHVEGRDLDSAYAQFKGTHCDSCGDQIPRPTTWKYNGRPSSEEAGFLVKLIGTPFDMRYVPKD
jgi:hypothetical protein